MQIGKYDIDEAQIFCFFLFVNTSSGGNLGSRLLEQEVIIIIGRYKRFSLS